MFRQALKISSQWHIKRKKGIYIEHRWNNKKCRRFELGTHGNSLIQISDFAASMGVTNDFFVPEI